MPNPQLTPDPTPNPSPNPTPDPIPVSDKSLTLAVEWLQSDGKLHLPVNQRQLPDQAIVAIKKNGENTGYLVPIKWKKEEQDGLQKAAAGDYQLVAEPLADIIINDQNYGQPLFETNLVITD